MAELELDPRWEWVEIFSLDGKVIYAKARCAHLELEPVHTVNGQMVARLCLTCDEQLPPYDPGGII